MGAREGTWGCTQGGGMHPKPPDPAPAVIPPRQGLRLSQAQGVWSGDCTPRVQPVGLGALHGWDRIWHRYPGGLGVMWVQSPRVTGCCLRQVEALQEVLEKLKSKRVPHYEKKFGQVPMVSAPAGRGGTGRDGRGRGGACPSPPAAARSATPGSSAP